MPLQLRSEIKSNHTLELSLVDVPMPVPSSDEVLVRIEASPVNPSDLGMLFGSADMLTSTFTGSEDRPIVTAEVPEHLMSAMGGRIDRSLPVGNEGAGIVVAAGSSEAAQVLMNKVVGISGGGMYSQYRLMKAVQCVPMPVGVTSAESASSFINPLTALGMIETMKAEGHKALIHTAAASNLGQMLNKICLVDGIELVNVVRKPEQVAILRDIGAKYVVDSSSDSFMEDLIQAIVDTGATLAFDAIGGGELVNNLLIAMEAAANKAATEYSPYGSTVHKQVYIYGGLNRASSTLTRNYGMSWGVGGWLLTAFLKKAGLAKIIKLQTRVAMEIKTTFKSTYTNEVSLADALSFEAIMQYSKQATGEKFLINPNKVSGAKSISP